MNHLIGIDFEFNDNRLIKMLEEEGFDIITYRIAMEYIRLLGSNKDSINTKAAYRLKYFEDMTEHEAFVFKNRIDDMLDKRVNQIIEEYFEGISENLEEKILESALMEECFTKWLKSKKIKAQVEERYSKWIDKLCDKVDKEITND